MKPSIVVARPIFPEVLDKLSRHFEVRSNQQDVPWTAESWKVALSASQGALTTGSDPVKADVLPACTQLRICANMAVGYNNFDVDAMTAAAHPDRHFKHWLIAPAVFLLLLVGLFPLFYSLAVSFQSLISDHRWWLVGEVGLEPTKA